MTATAALRTTALTKVFHAGQANELVAISGISMEVPRGSCVLLRGSSGSGKTTLLTILGGLSRPSSGEYVCLGQPVSHWSEKFLADFRRRHIGIIFQQFHLMAGLAVWQNIALPLLCTDIGPAALRGRVEGAAEAAGIGHRLSAAAGVLSGGEMQRVAIARALISDPDLILADEPTSQLDSGHAARILEVLAGLKARGKTIVLTSHDPAVQRHAMIDQVVTLHDGKLA